MFKKDGKFGTSVTKLWKQSKRQAITLTKAVSSQPRSKHQPLVTPNENDQPPESQQGDCKTPESDNGSATGTSAAETLPPDHMYRDWPPHTNLPHTSQGEHSNKREEHLVHCNHTAGQYGNQQEQRKASYPSPHSSRGAGSGIYSPMRGQLVRANSIPHAWTPPPDEGFKTSELRTKLMARYGITAQDVQEALNFAEAAQLADLFCFTFCLIGGPMKCDTFQEATDHGYKKENLRAKYRNASTGLNGKPLTPEQQKIKEHALEVFQSEQQAAEDDIEQIREDETERLRAEVNGLSLEEGLRLLGVPGPGFGRNDVERALHPQKGRDTCTEEENARRDAAYDVAVELFEGV